MKKFLFAVDFGNFGSKYYEVLAETQKEGHNNVWANLNDGTMKQSNVESIEMIDVMNTEETPAYDWVNTVKLVDEKDIVSWGKI